MSDKPIYNLSGAEKDVLHRTLMRSVKVESHPTPPQGSGEIARLQEIEHRAWHLLDDSEQRGEEIVLTRGEDYDELCKLLPEEHPRALTAASAQSAAGAEAAAINNMLLLCCEEIERHCGNKAGLRGADHLAEGEQIRKMLKATLAAAHARPAPPAVPEGWRLVPETLITRPMIEAGINSQETTKAEDPDGAISVCATWEAMLSAAPRAKEGA